ncbi:glycoside hydrolase superfamily [Mrakia frigida]|uniref:glycoside hydrolase superfamily n=1 Tax=Mrakia frigida TaxID=29902 RepID=UPI003FCC2271
MPACGATQDAVTADMALLAQLTPRIRLYGADCDQSNLVLQGIKDAGVPLTTWLGIFIDGNETTFVRQLDLITAALETHGTDNVSGVTVGNEYLLMGGELAILETFIQRTNETILALNLNKTIPISTSEAGAPITPSLCAAVDQVFGNAHCWFGSVPVEECAVWTNDYYEDFIVDVCDYGNGTTTGKSTILSETGWPTASDSPEFESNGASLASIPNLQIFLDSFVCQANQNNTEYFFFAFRDEPWKAALGGVEPHWGLLDVNSELKEGLVIPDCFVPLPEGLSEVTRAPSTSASLPTATSTTPSSEPTSEPSARISIPVESGGLGRRREEMYWSFLAVVASLLALFLL